MHDACGRSPSAPAGPALMILLALLFAGCSDAGGPSQAQAPPEVPVIAGVKTSLAAEDVPRRLARYVPTRIQANVASLTEADRRVLDSLIEASRQMGEVFSMQAWAANPDLRAHLTRARGARAQKLVTYFDVNAGPWDRIDESPFIGDLPRPEAAGFYPHDMSREDFDRWIAERPGDAEAFKSLFTIITREGGGLKAVPYSEAYKPWLERASAELRKAAAETDNASLKAFLEKRAEAFLTDDYYDSDVAWMDLDSVIEVTIGPYETYEDRLFGYKVAFTSFVTIQDAEASSRLAFYKNELPSMERNLPIPAEYKNLTRGTESPIRVVDVAFTEGDTRAGIQTIAYNLPNDERVREAKGSKKVLLRNVMNAKFRSILEPIGRRLIAEGQQSHVTAEAFFNETLFHELSHGLGPGKIKVAGRDTEVRLELREHYSALEEAKADVMGAWNILYMIGREQFPASFREDLFVTFLAGMFRSVRFGIEEAHGQGVALQYGYLKAKGAFAHDPATGRFSVDASKFEAGLRDLVRDICLVQARGDYAGAAKMLQTWAKVPPELQAALDGIADIPVDIRPIYVAAGERG